MPMTEQLEQNMRTFAHIPNHSAITVRNNLVQINWSAVGVHTDNIHTHTAKHIFNDIRRRPTSLARTPTPAAKSWAGRHARNAKRAPSCLGHGQCDNRCNRLRHQPIAMST